MLPRPGLVRGSFWGQLLRDAHTQHTSPPHTDQLCCLRDPAPAAPLTPALPRVTG
ncbi:hypothetical protein ONE63_008018 [Megalurothrips usitatus]|uniref:Uncharacterized protein n=1 Tax=Megalurothrips usitatus TaxID=439358 RepID=A0AAV7XS10_9NEOP|nr:hypothetical protein ONE63_008018 [Megalurothrips usitatus]